jgi:hypothetical protein
LPFVVLSTFDILSPLHHHRTYIILHHHSSFLPSILTSFLPS